jgi:hypothetical protein
MPTIPLTDGFGLNVSMTPTTGALLKYFKNLPGFNIAKVNVAQIASKTLADVTTDLSFTACLNFANSIAIGTSGVELTAAASAGGTLALFVPDKDGAPLFDPDQFGDNIAVAKNRRYVSLQLNTSISPGVSETSGDLTFGFQAQSGVTLGYYQLFPADDTKVIDAIEETISSFTIPADLDDIQGMAEGSVATAEGTGQLTFSGSVNLLAVTNPLASATLPMLGALGVTGGASVTVGASYTYSGDYQVRVQRLAGSSFRLGFYRRRKSDYSVTASANASVTATIGTSTNDLIVKLITAISSQPEADVKALQQAGLSAAEIGNIQSAIKCAVNRCLGIGATLEFETADTSEAMFLYQVDLRALQPDGRAMLHAALEGKLDQLVAADTQFPAGISVIKTCISQTKTFQHSLKVNLLGIYNFLQLSSLVLKGSAAWDAATGALVLTDQITAAKIGVSTNNLQADSQKLLKVMAQQFLITAAYRSVSNIVNSGPALTAQQSYYEMQHNASALQVRNDLLTAAALGLLSPADAIGKLPGGVSQFGAETVYAEAIYDDPAFRSLFLTDGKLRDMNDYIAAGKKAITMIVQPHDQDDFRLILATHDGLYEQLASNGNTQSKIFQQMLIDAGVPSANVVAAGVDYTDIAWLAQAMNSTGVKLLAIDQYLAAHPGTDPGNHDFLQLKKALADQVGRVAQLATEHFGGPWGFNAMTLLGSSSARKWFLTNAHVSGVYESAKTGAAGG